MKIKLLTPNLLTDSRTGKTVLIKANEIFDLTKKGEYFVLTNESGIFALSQEKYSDLKKEIIGEETMEQKELFKKEEIKNPISSKPAFKIKREKSPLLYTANEIKSLKEKSLKEKVNLVLKDLIEQVNKNLELMVSEEGPDEFEISLGEETTLNKMAFCELIKVLENAGFKIIKIDEVNYKVSL